MAWQWDGWGARGKGPLEEGAEGGGLEAGVCFECRATATSMLMRWTWKNIDLEEGQMEIGCT